MYILYIIIILFIIYIIFKIKKKKDLKDLTGNYVCLKDSNGCHYKVQYKLNNKLLMRTATKNDLLILKKYKYL